MATAEKGGVQMLKTSFNAGWIYHDGGGGALDALIHGGGRITESRLRCHMMLQWQGPETAGSRNGSGNGFFVEENCYYTKEFWGG